MLRLVDVDGGAIVLCEQAVYFVVVHGRLLSHQIHHSIRVYSHTSILVVVRSAVGETGGRRGSRHVQTHESDIPSRRAGHHDSHTLCHSDYFPPSHSAGPSSSPRRMQSGQLQLSQHSHSHSSTAHVIE